MELLAALMAGFCLGYGLAAGSRVLLLLALVFAVAGFMLSLGK
jgi:hypothetical protein